jgi:hypothetical protein
MIATALLPIYTYLPAYLPPPNHPPTCVVECLNQVCQSWSGKWEQKPTHPVF